MGAKLRSDRSTAIKSASLPASKLPILSSRPSIRAPLMVAIASASWALTTVASWLTDLATMAAVRISSSMSRLLLLAAPSVPMATLMPALIRSPTGQKPLASFKFDSGQCATCTLLSASNVISPASSWVICTVCNKGDSNPRLCMRAIGRWPCWRMASCTSVSVSWRCR